MGFLALKGKKLQQELFDMAEFVPTDRVHQLSFFVCQWL